MKIISTDYTVEFLEYYNRYNVDIFSVNYYFIGLLDEKSHIVVAQKFIISTCLRYVDIQY